MNAYVVSREKLAGNIEELKKQANGVPIWAVIKGNAYGLGVLPVAKLLREHGIERFCITDLQEAETLRENGFAQEKILMLRSVCDGEELSRLLRHHVILTIGSVEAAEAAEKAAAGCDISAEAHVKIDTGMGRYGFQPDDLEHIKKVYRELLHVTVSGIYTHFNCAYCDERRTRKEYESFRHVLELLREEGIETGAAHCCNSSAFLKVPEMHMDGVRLGSAILGRMAFPTSLQPVGFCETQVEELHTLHKGQATGYGGIWKAKRETELAILPVGWYHGFRVSCEPDMTKASACFRSGLSALKGLLVRKRTFVKIGEQSCPVVGAIGMLQCAVDVTGKNVKRGAPVILQINPLHVKGMEVQFR